MNENLQIVAQRIIALRDIVGISLEEMAEAVELSVEEYSEYEEGNRDFSLSMLYTISEKFGIDITDIITGESARLSLYSLVRKGEGTVTERRNTYDYVHLAPIFKKKKMEPFLISVDPEDTDAEIQKNSHKGHEFNYIVEGSMLLYIEDEVLELHEGDSVYFDSKHPHALRAHKEPCKFLAILSK